MARFDGEKSHQPRIALRLWLTNRPVEAHVRSIMTKLGLADSDEDHRRVLAVLVYLSTSASSPQRPPVAQRVSTV